MRSSRRNRFIYRYGCFLEVYFYTRKNCTCPSGQISYIETQENKILKFIRHSFYRYLENSICPSDQISYIETQKKRDLDSSETPLKSEMQQSVMQHVKSLMM